MHLTRGENWEFWGELVYSGVYSAPGAKEVLGSEG